MEYKRTKERDGEEQLYGLAWRNLWFRRREAQFKCFPLQEYFPVCFLRWEDEDVCDEGEDNGGPLRPFVLGVRC
jgi:hypothetical protein